MFIIKNWARGLLIVSLGGQPPPHATPTPEGDTRIVLMPKVPQTPPLHYKKYSINQSQTENLIHQRNDLKSRQHKKIMIEKLYRRVNTTKMPPK